MAESESRAEFARLQRWEPSLLYQFNQCHVQLDGAVEEDDEGDAMLPVNLNHQKAQVCVDAVNASDKKDQNSKQPRFMQLTVSAQRKQVDRRSRAQVRVNNLIASMMLCDDSVCCSFQHLIWCILDFC